ncbi:MAG TPA: 2,3-diphosphoglycerate synthetase [Acidimicrobiia bacterium]|nr:2,3-diphosphoglycerate synthetase [Acidimicrobiia bacterium]
MAPRTLVLVDGEHYPPVVRAALDGLRAAGNEIVGAALLGGGEKLRVDEAPDYGLAPDTIVAGATPLDAMRAGLEQFGPDEVVDLSDEPVLDARMRMLLAAHALHRGVPYRGADFRFDPPPRPRLATKPSVAVIGTGKRTGKTAVASAVARVLAADGRAPVIVAMGRGGPSEPELIDPAATDLSPAGLVARADAGRHAASDHLEDALTAGVTTVGTRRCGGGLAGAPVSSTFAEGVALANARPETLLVLEGSGAAIPPVHADATICVVPATADPEVATGYLGPYALLLSDVVVVTLSEVGPPGSSRAAVRSGLEDRIRSIIPDTPVLRTVLRPWPLASIAQRSIFFATTAPEPVAARSAAHLESRHHANVVGWTSHLSERARLAEDLARLPDGVEVLVTELKAAAVDVATRTALERGMEVIFCDNRPEPVSPGDGADELEATVATVAELAARRFEAAASS